MLMEIYGAMVCRAEFGGLCHKQMEFRQEKTTHCVISFEAA